MTTTGVIVARYHMDHVSDHDGTVVVTNGGILAGEGSWRSLFLRVMMLTGG